MFGGQHRHLVWAHLHVLLRMWIVTNNWFHRLLIFIATIITIRMVALRVDHTRALTQLPSHFFFVEVGCSIARLHLRQASALCSWLRNSSLTVDVLELNARLNL